MKTYQTPAGKELQLYICPKTAHIKIKFGGGGEVPEELAGLYTAEKNAEKDIQVYLDKIKDRKIKSNS